MKTSISGGAAILSFIAPTARATQRTFVSESFASGLKSFRTLR